MNAVVTVGLDGTPESLSAALWAAQEASARGATLRLLHAWVMLAPEGDAQQSENDPNYWPKRIVSDARDAIGQRFPDLRVYEDLVAREPMDALLEAATESQTLVLGSRALSSLTGYFLGDIGMHVLARAEVPTVLVRAGEDTAPITEDGDVVLGLSLRRPCDELIEYAFDAAIRRDSTLRVVHGRNLPPSAYNRGGLDPYLSHELTREAQQDPHQDAQSMARPVPRRAGRGECADGEPGARRRARHRRYGTARRRPSGEASTVSPSYRSCAVGGRAPRSLPGCRRPPHLTSRKTWQGSPRSPGTRRRAPTRKTPGRRSPLR